MSEARTLETGIAVEKAEPPLALPPKRGSRRECGELIDFEPGGVNFRAARNR